METLFSLDAQLLFNVVLLAISVFILFVALSYLLFEPVRSLLQKRKEKIEIDLEQANVKKKEAEHLKVAYEEKRNQAWTEAEAILKASRQKALKNEKVIVEEARARAVEMKNQAKKHIDFERLQAQEDMKREMIVLAELLAKKALSTSINEEIQDALIEETLKELDGTIWVN